MTGLTDFSSRAFKMIVHFAYETEELVLLNQQVLSRAVPELLRAHRYAHHLVVIAREVADWLLQNIALTPKDHATLEQIKRDYTQTADLIRRCSNLIRVRNVSAPHIIAEGKFINVDLQVVAQPYLLERSALVVEDLQTDGRLYSLLLDYLKNKVGVPYLSYEIMHGGGSRTMDVATDKAADKRIVCAIFDTDRKRPLDTKPNKVRLIEEAADRLNWPLLSAVAPNCREIENIVPFRIAKALPCAVDNKSIADIESIISIDLQIGALSSEFYWLYFDLKAGCDFEKLEKMSNQEDVNWIKSKIDVVRKGRVTGKISGFGPNVIPQLLDHAQSNPDFKTFVNSKDWWDYFGDHFSYLMWICAAPRASFT